MNVAGRQFPSFRRNGLLLRSRRNRFARRSYFHIGHPLLWSLDDHCIGKLRHELLDEFQASLVLSTVAEQLTQSKIGTTFRVTGEVLQDTTTDALYKIF